MHDLLNRLISILSLSDMVNSNYAIYLKKSKLIIPTIISK